MDREKNIQLIQNNLLDSKTWFYIINIYFVKNKYGYWTKRILSKDGEKQVYFINSHGFEIY